MLEIPLKVESEEDLEDLQVDTDLIAALCAHKAFSARTKKIFKSSDPASEKTNFGNTQNGTEIAADETSLGMPVNEHDFMHIDVDSVKFEWPKSEPCNAIVENEFIVQSTTAKRSGPQETSLNSYNLRNGSKPRRRVEQVLFENPAFQNTTTGSLLSGSVSSDRLRNESPLPELSVFLSESLLHLPPLSPPPGTEFPGSFVSEESEFKSPFILQQASADGLTHSTGGHYLTPSELERTCHLRRRDEFSTFSQPVGLDGQDRSDEEFKRKFERAEDMDYILRNYHKGGINTNDSYIYCDLCNRKWKGSCSVHGALSHIKDARVPVSTFGRAERTTPKGLIVSTSGIKGANNGVWSCREVPARSVYGPYKGVIVTTNSECGEYCWEIVKDGKVSHYVDASDPDRSNWMRYVNCARNVAEQNLEAFQHRSEIYYRATRKIQPNEELLVWYGLHFAQKLGIKWTDFVQSRTPEQADTAHSCKFCFHAFSNPVYLARHKMYCRGTPRTDPSKIDKPKEGQRSVDSQEHSFSNTLPPSLQRSTVCMKVSTGDKPITCGVCGARFHRRDELLQAHMKTHVGAKHTCCNKCGQWFPHETSLKAHKTNAHGSREKKFYLTRTQRSMSTDDENNSITEGKLFTCFECKCPFYSKTALERHITRRNVNILSGAGQSDKEVTNCSFSAVRTESRLARKRNSLTWASLPPKKKQEVCCRRNRSQTTSQELCRLLADMKQSLSGDGSGKSTSSTNPTDTTIFQEAEQVLKSLKKRSDDSRSKSTASRSKSTASRSKSTEKNAPAFQKPSEKTLLCELCGALFWRRVTLETHLEIRHDKPSKRKAFYFKDGPKRFECSLCKIRYREKSTLELHLRVHEKETSDDHEDSDENVNKNPFECKICGVSFKAEMTLKYHMRIHKDEASNKIRNETSAKDDQSNNSSNKRPFKCMECGTRYRALFTLNAHMKVHAEKPSSASLLSTNKSYLSCPQCKSLFNTLAAYEAHSKTHIVHSLSSIGQDMSTSDDWSTSSINGSVISGSSKTSSRADKKSLPSIKSAPNDRKKQEVEKAKFPCRERSAPISDKSSGAHRRGSCSGTSASLNDNTCADSVFWSETERSSGKGRLPKLEIPTQDGKEAALLKCDDSLISSSTAVHKQMNIPPLTYDCLACGLNFKERATLDAHVLEHVKEKEFYCDLSAVRISAYTNST